MATNDHEQLQGDIDIVSHDFGDGEGRSERIRPGVGCR